MSSSFHPPAHLHLHSHGKRPFEECGGYDSDSMPTTSSGTSSSHRFSTASNTETRNKRARSTSSSSTDDSNPSSSSGYNTAQSSSRSDLSPSVNAVDCPVASPSFLPHHQVHMSDLHLPIPQQRPHEPSPPIQEDSLRTSLQRFAEFDRQIAALRTSLAASTRSPPLPPFPSSAPSVDGDPAPSNNHWHPNSSNFLPNGTPLDFAPNVSFPPNDSFASSNGQHATVRLDSINLLSPPDSSNLVATTSTPSASFTPAFGNPRYPPCPPYRPSPGGSSSLVAHARLGQPIASSSAPPIMRPSNENISRGGARSSLFVEAPSASHIRRVRGSLSPLAFSSDPPSLSPPPMDTDDILLRYRTLNDGDPVNARSQRIDNPVINQDPLVSSRPGDQPAPRRPFARARVFREHSVERDPVPTVFDVFSLDDSAQNQSAPSVGASRFASIAEPTAPRALNERPRGPAPITTPTSATSQDTFPRPNSSWSSVPSSNSLMSESASERRHALALERFRARSGRSSFDADDESDRWFQDWPGGRENGHNRVASPVSVSPSLEGIASIPHLGPFDVTGPRVPPTTSRTEPATSTSFQRSLSELFSESDRIERVDPWMPSWDASRMTEQERPLREQERERQLDRQRDRTWEWERQRERTTGRGFTSGVTRPSTSLLREVPTPPVPIMAGPSGPSLGLGIGPSTAPSIAPTTTTTTTTTTTNGNRQYSYSNLDLSSFQSGLFRDSLRRNAEVDQASFPSAIPSMNTGESRTASRLGFDDNESDMELDDFVRTRPPSPEWSRPQPYAGRTPPPDYSPPPRNFSLRPGNFSVWRRNSIVFDPPMRAPPQRSTFTSPVRPGTSGPTHTTYENNHRSPERSERDRFMPTRRLFESFYRSHEDGRRNASPAPAFHAPPPNHPPTNLRHDVMGGPRSASANGNGNRAGTDVGSEHRRGSLGLGGTIRSRLARFTNTQSPAQESSTRPRLASHPIGARPQTEQRRASVFGEQERAPMGWSGEARDVPWRAPPGQRTFGPAGATRGEAGEAEQRSRLRMLRQRFQLDRGGEGMRVFRPGMLRAMGRRGNLGDYVPDELFDDSYEALLSLSSMLGEVRSKATPEDIIASLPTGTFKEWKRDDSETRCPICLEDYEPSDAVTKLIECPHWLHKNCLEQWLRTANTCPVCREKVKSSPKPAFRRRPFREAPERPPQTSAQPNHGRPVSFAAIVFDGRDPTESWPSTSQGTGARDMHNVFRARLRAREQQRTQGPELPFHIRVPPPQPGPLTRPSTSAVPLRGQGSGSSASTGSSVDEVRRPVFPFVPPPVVTSEWRVEVESRSSSSGSSSSSVGNRLPIHEDSPSEEYMFGWHLER